MCSNSPTESEFLKPKVSLISEVCRKCSAKASILLQSKFSYCRECFLEYFKHKFRATLGKSKIMKHGDKILIAFSGSASSLCLIDLIRDSLSDGKKKKMSFDVNVLFIDESSAFIENGSKQPNLIEIRDTLTPYNFKFYSTDLGAFLVNDLNLDENNLYNDVTKIDDMKQLFFKFQTSTSKTDLLVKIRTNILFNVAYKLGCQKIFSAETSDHLAINTIANIVQGRGGQLPQDIGFSNDRIPSVILVRPLQDCSKKEVNFYNVFNNLKSVSSTTFSTKGDKYSSIQRLSESFINELQNSFPSTVLTVHATGSKLSTVREVDDKQECCCLCQGKIDENRLPVTAQAASHISKLVSNLGPLGFNSRSLTPFKNINVPESSSPCLSNGCVCLGSTNEKSLTTFIEKSLCYGCQLIVRECKSLESLPKTFFTKLQEKTQLNQMHDEIKSFLL